MPKAVYYRLTDEGLRSLLEQYKDGFVDLVRILKNNKESNSDMVKEVIDFFRVGLDSI